MAVARIKKLELYVHKSIIDNVLASLQKVGVCEIISGEQGEGSVEVSTGELQELDACLSESRFLLRFFDTYYVDDVGSMARALGERPVKSLLELASLARDTDITSLAEQMRKLERRMVEIRSELSQIESLQLMLAKLKDFPYALELVSQGTETIRGVLGTIPVEQFSEWNDSLLGKAREDVEIYVAPYDDKAKETWVAAFFLKELEDEVQDICSRHNFSKIELPAGLIGMVDEENSKLTARSTELKDEEEINHRQAAAAAAKNMQTIRALSDYWSVLKSRTEVLESGEYTDQIVLLKAWVPAGSVELLKEELSQYEELVELLFSEPTNEDDPPCMLKNHKWSLPYETLTRLYGAPKYGELDPTPLLAPFFFIFFGMCLGDGGYGLVVIGFFAYFLHKYKRMPSGTKQFFKLFVLAGIATVIVGALTGGWLGDMVDAFSFLHFLKPIKDAPVVLNPMNDPMTFLGISLAFGLVQILFGLFIAFYDCLRKKDYMGAFADQGGWLLLLIGITLFCGVLTGKVPSGLGMVSKVMMSAGALILIFTQGREKKGVFRKALSGILSLYNITSYLGDFLSYSRLLALGLATSAIAMIVNMLSTLVSGIPYIGWVFAIVLFIGGHLFSVAVNVLGAFVHSLRLQYVEFFSKFYKGGGKFFTPLCYTTSFVEISEASKDI